MGLLPPRLPTGGDDGVEVQLWVGREVVRFDVLHVNGLLHPWDRAGWGGDKKLHIGVEENAPLPHGLLGHTIFGVGGTPTHSPAQHIPSP